MGLEDIALMRALPTMGVFQPMDSVETEHLMKYLVETYRGPAYLRLTRQALPVLTPPNSTFAFGKLLEITPQGARTPSGTATTVQLIGSGAGSAEAVKAAAILAGAGVSTRVWNAHALKPFDAETVRRELCGSANGHQTSEIIATVEDHSVIGGLGSAVEEVLAALPEHPRLLKFGVQDLFGESGEADELYEKFGISGAKVADGILRVLKGR